MMHASNCIRSQVVSASVHLGPGAHCMRCICTSLQAGQSYVQTVNGMRAFKLALPRKIAPKNGVVIDGNIYMTLDEVNPRAGYGKDKGLSDSTCHRHNHKRAIPSGWEIAPEPSHRIMLLCSKLQGGWKCEKLIKPSRSCHGKPLVTPTYDIGIMLL